MTAAGATAGLLDIAMTTEATAVERELARPVLTRVNAAGSAAFALGAIVGSLLASRAGPMWCALLVAAVVLPVMWEAARLGPRHPAPMPAHGHAGSAGFGPTVPMLGAVLGLSIAAETTAAMWSSSFLAGQAIELAAYADAGAAIFVGCQAVVRWFGDPLRRRFGDCRIIIVSLALAAGGFAVVAWSEDFGSSLFGFALVGLGTGCVVPCCFALVARSAPHRPAAALAPASLLAGAVHLPTPLCVGMMATVCSDATAFAGIAAALVGGLLLYGVCTARSADEHRGAPPRA